MTWPVYALFISVLAWPVWSQASAQPPPHIIFLLADDLGWNDVSFQGSNDIKTPNLDALAADGVWLRSYYTDTSCTPSRSALMTSRYSSNIGMQHSVLIGTEPRGLPLNLTIMPQHFKNLGYDTHMLGKWHLGFYMHEYTPTFRGFDSHFGFWTGERDYYDGTSTNTRYTTTWGRDLRINMEFDVQDNGNYSTEDFTKQALQIIDNHNSSTPLFLYFAHQAVHAATPPKPLQAPPSYIDRFENIRQTHRQIFAAMASAMDDSVGEVFAALHQKGMLNNTVIVFASDNGGEYPGYWNGSASNWPLRGKKDTYWEGGLRVPAFVWSPMIAQPGRTWEGMFHVTDWMPTLYHIAGGNISDLGEIDGVDQWDSISTGAPTNRTEFLIVIDPILRTTAVRVGDFKLLQGPQPDEGWNGWYGPTADVLGPYPFNFTSVSVVQPILEDMGRGGFPLPQDRPQDFICGPPPPDPNEVCNPEIEPCLFNIYLDPCEYHNLAKSNTEMLQQLISRLEEYNKTVEYPTNKPLDPRGDPQYYNYVWVNWYDYLPLK